MRLRTTLTWSAVVVAAAVAGSLWMSAWPRWHDQPTEAAVAARVRAAAQAPRTTPRPARHHTHHTAAPALAQPSSLAPPATSFPTTLAPVYAPSPRYPMEALRHDREGTVTLRVTVDGGGNVTDVAVAGSSGDAKIDASALAAVRRWRFAAPPGGAAMTFEYPVRFRIGGHVPPHAPQEPG